MDFAAARFHDDAQKSFDVDAFLDAVDLLYEKTITFAGSNKMREMALLVGVHNIPALSLPRGKFQNDGRKMPIDFVLDMFVWIRKIRDERKQLLRCIVCVSSTVERDCKTNASRTTTCSECKKRKR